MQYSWNKYGRNNFIFTVIEFCDINKLIERESFWIWLINPKFNICKVSKSQLGVKRSKDFILKMKQTLTGRKHSENHKLNNSLSKIGKKQTKEHTEKIASQKRGIKLSEEHKAKLKLAWERRMLRIAREF